MELQHIAREFLNNNYTNRWIGRRGPIAWPARSPDLNPLDFYLWGHLKTIVYLAAVEVLRIRRSPFPLGQPDKILKVSLPSLLVAK
jgi:hypothetical protein